MSPVERAVAETFRAEAPRVIAALTRLLRDVSLAEELAQDALELALTEWPRTGVPARPGAWMMTTAKHRALNHLRHRRVHERAEPELVHLSGPHLPLSDVEAALEAGMDDDVADDVLRLLFVACHPVLAREQRVALTLRMIGGLRTDEIARAFLTSEPTMAQRIVRAKRALSEARVPFEVPRGAELGARLSSVLEVVYLIFNEGYSASAGEDLVRPALMGEALRLGSLLAALAPAEPEAHALVSLMELHGARLPARLDAQGEPVLLLHQDRARWDRGRIEAGLLALARADALTDRPGDYHLQAAIAAVHARAQVASDTDWAAIAALYGALMARTPSPVVELNRAIALSFAEGPARALEVLDALVEGGALAGYHLLPAARADVLERMGRREEARAEFLRAAELADNARQKARLLARAGLTTEA